MRNYNQGRGQRISNRRSRVPNRNRVPNRSRGLGDTVAKTINKYI